jgi:hypothetical protein
MFSKINFLQTWNSSCEQQHKDEMFDQMLKKRYNQYCMSLYTEINYDDLRILMNGSDIFTKVFRMRRTRDGCRISCI